MHSYLSRGVVLPYFLRVQDQIREGMGLHHESYPVKLSIDLLVERHRGYAPKPLMSWHGTFDSGKLPIDLKFVTRTRISPRDRGRLLQAARIYAVRR